MLKNNLTLAHPSDLNPIGKYVRDTLELLFAYCSALTAQSVRSDQVINNDLLIRLLGPYEGIRSLIFFVRPELA